MKKKILFLEKVIETSIILPDLLLNNDFEIDAISSISKAVKLIKKNIYNLIYLNIEFLEVNIISLFETLINKKYSGQIIFSGDYKNPIVIKKINYFKTLNVLIKPFDNAWLRNTINNHLKTGQSIGNNSSKALSLFFILKIINFYKESITLKINFRNKKGLIVIEKGIIVHSKFDNKEGLYALKNMIEIEIPLGEKEISISTPGFFIKKDTNINLNSVLESYENPEKNTEIIKYGQSVQYSPFILFMVEHLKKYTVSSDKIIKETISEMGFSIEIFPMSGEIDLIMNVSKKIIESDYQTEFKNLMVNYLKKRQ